MTQLSFSRGPRWLGLALAALVLSGSAAAFAQSAEIPPSPPPASTTSAPLAGAPLPPGVLRVQLGTAVRDRSATGVARCRIPEPLPAPYRFEPGTTEIAYTIEVDPQTVKGVTAKVSGDSGCSAEPWSQGCVGYTVCGGGVCQNQYGATLKCPNDKPLKKGTYKLAITVSGKTVELPFEVQ